MNQKALPEGWEYSGDAVPQDVAGAAQSSAVDKRTGLPEGWDYTNEEFQFGVGDYAQSATSGFNTGLADMLGMPVDVIAAAMRAAGVDINDPVMSSDWIKKNLPGGMFKPGATDRLGRIIGRTGQELGASTPVAGAALTAARSAAPSYQGIKSLWQSYLDPIRRSPMTASLGEGVAATGAGIGAGIAQEAAPDSPTAEMAGQLAGGLAPTILMNTPSALVTRGLTAAGKSLGPAASSQAARDQVFRDMGKEITPEARQAIAEAERMRQKIPGFAPSLAESTGSPSLIATQKSLESRASGADLESMVARKKQSTEAINEFARSTAPQAEPVPEMVIDTAARKIDDLRYGVAAQEAEAARKRMSLTGQVPPADQELIGANIRDQLNKRRRSVLDHMNRRAQELGINDADVSIEFAGVAKRLADDFSPQSIFDDAKNYPPVVESLKRASEGGEFTFKDLKSLRERVSDDLIDAVSASDPSAKRIRTLTLLKKRIDDSIDDLMDTIDPALANNYKTFRKEYFDEYVKKFETSVPLKLRIKDRVEYRTPDEKVAEAFFKKGNVRSAKQFNTIFSNNPDTVAALEAAAVDQFRMATVNENVINPGRMRQWLKDHESVLNQFPSLKEKLTNIDSAESLVAAREAQLAGRRAQIGDALLTKEVDAYARGSKTADQVIDSALRDNRRMGELVNRLRTKPEAMESLRRVLWDRATSGNSDDTMDFLANYGKSIETAMGKAHYNNILDIAAARGMMERVPAPVGKGIEHRPLEWLEKYIGQGLPQLASRIFAWKSGRMQKGYLATDVAMRTIRGKAAVNADQLYKAAMYDPEIAKDFAEALTDAGRRGVLDDKKARRLHARYMALGLPTLEEGEDGSPSPLEQGFKRVIEGP